MTIEIVSERAAIMLVIVAAMTLVLCSTLIVAAIIALRDRHKLSRSQRRRIDHQRFIRRLRELQQ